jgi:hypothetical protein
MIEGDILEIMNNRLLTLELIVDEIHDTLVSNGVIDEEKFDSSIAEKIARIKQITDSLESELDESPIIPNFFGGPIGEA